MTLHPYTVICPRCSSPANYTHGRYFCSGCWWCQWCGGTCNGTTATGCRGTEGKPGKPEPTTEPKRNKVCVATPALHLAMEAGGMVERGDHSPWHCPSCGEWETTHRAESTWWESFYKGWVEFGAMVCPRCSHRYPL